MFDLLQLFCAPALLMDGGVGAASPPPVPVPTPARPAARTPDATPAATDPATGASLLAAAEQVAHDTMDVAHGSAAPAQVKQALANVQATVQALRAALDPNALEREGGPQRCNELAAKLREQVAALTACVTSSCDPAFGKSLQQRMAAGGPVDQRAADAFAARATAHPEELRAALVNSSTNRVDPQQVEKYKTLLQGMSDPARQAADAALHRAGLSMEVDEVRLGPATTRGAAARLSLDVGLTRSRTGAGTSQMDATVGGQVRVNAEELRADVEGLMRDILKGKDGTVGHVDIQKGPPLRFIVPFETDVKGEMTITPLANGTFSLHIGGTAGDALRYLPDRWANPNDTAVALRAAGCTVPDPIPDPLGGFTYVIAPNLDATGGKSLFSTLRLPTSVPLNGDSRVDLQNVSITNASYTINNNGEVVCDFQARGEGTLNQGTGHRASHLPVPDQVSAHVEVRVPHGYNREASEFDVRDATVSLQVNPADAAAAARYLKQSGYGDVNAQGHVTLKLSGHYDADGNSQTAADLAVTGADAHYHQGDTDVQLHGTAAHVTADVDVQQRPEVLRQEQAIRDLEQQRPALVRARDDAADLIMRKSKEIDKEVGMFSRGSTDQRLLRELDALQERFNGLNTEIQQLDTRIKDAKGALATITDQHKADVTVAVHHADATVHDSVVSIGGKQITLTDAQIKDLGLAELKLNGDGSRDLTGLHVDLNLESGSLTIGDKRVWLMGAQLQSLGVEHLHQGTDGRVDLAGVAGGLSFRAGGIVIGDKLVHLMEAQIKDLGLDKLTRKPDGSLDLQGLRVSLDARTGVIKVGDKEAVLTDVQLRELRAASVTVDSAGAIDVKNISGGAKIQGGRLSLGDKSAQLTDAQLRELNVASLHVGADGAIDLKGLGGKVSIQDGTLTIGDKRVRLTDAQLTALGVGASVEASRTGTLNIKRLEGGTTIKGDVLSLGDKSAQLTPDQLRELNVAGLRVGPDGAIDLKTLGGRVGIQDGNLTIGTRQVQLTDAQLIALGVVKTSAGGDLELSTGIRVAIHGLAAAAEELARNPKLPPDAAAAVLDAARKGDAPALTQALDALRFAHPDLAPEIDALAGKKDKVIEAARAGVVLSGAQVTQENGVTTITGGMRLSADVGKVSWQGGPQTTTTAGPRSVGAPASDTATRNIRAALLNDWEKLSHRGSEGLMDGVEALIQDCTRGDAPDTQVNAAFLRYALKNRNPDQLIDGLMLMRSKYPAFAGRVDAILTHKVGDHSLRELQESQGQGRPTDATRLSSGQTTVASVRVNDGSATPQDVQFEFTANANDGSKSFKIKGGATMTLGAIAVLAENLPPDIPADQRASIQATLRRMIEFQGRADGWNMTVKNLAVTIDGQGAATCDADVVSTRTDGFTLPNPTDPLARQGEFRLGDVSLTGKLSLATDATGKLTKCDLTNAGVTWDYTKNQTELTNYLKNFLNNKLREANAGLEFTKVEFAPDGTLKLEIKNTNTAETRTMVGIRVDGKQLRLSDNTTFDNPLWNLTIVAPVFVNSIARGQASEHVQGVRRDQDGSLVGDPQAMARIPGLTLQDPHMDHGRFGFGFNYSMPPGN